MCVLVENFSEDKLVYLLSLVVIAAHDSIRWPFTRLEVNKFKILLFASLLYMFWSWAQLEEKEEEFLIYFEEGLE